MSVCYLFCVYVCVNYSIVTIRIIIFNNKFSLNNDEIIFFIALRELIFNA